MFLNVATMSFLFSVKAKRVEERRRGSAIRNGEAGEGAEPTHQGAEAYSQRGPIEIQLPSCFERTLPSTNVIRKGRFQRSAQGNEKRFCCVIFVCINSYGRKGSILLRIRSKH